MLGSIDGGLQSLFLRSSSGYRAFGFLARVSLRVESLNPGKRTAKYQSLSDHGILVGGVGPRHGGKQSIDD